LGVVAAVGQGLFHPRRFLATEAASLEAVILANGLVHRNLVTLRRRAVLNRRKDNDRRFEELLLSISTEGHESLRRLLAINDCERG